MTSGQDRTRRRRRRPLPRACRQRGGAGRPDPGRLRDRRPGRAGGAEPDVISSEAFISGTLPQRYTCHGAKINPPLNWSGAPPGTKSLALIVDDSSAPITPFIYWLVFDINPASTDIQEGSLPTGAREALNSAGNASLRRPVPGWPSALVPIYRLCVAHDAKAAQRRAAAGRGDGDRSGHNRAGTNSGNRTPVIIWIRLVISNIPEFFQSCDTLPTGKQQSMIKRVHGARDNEGRLASLAACA